MLISRLALVAAVAVALAGCQTSQPSQKVQNASVGELRDSARMFCVRTQANLQNASAAAVSAPCECYARRTFRALSKEEVDFSRDNGFFNESGVAKAKKALAQCGLKDPT
jgi:hypothetical protein